MALSTTKFVVFVSILFVGIVIGTIVFLNYDSNVVKPGINGIPCENITVRSEEEGPTFLGLIPNITATQGQNISVSCFVQSLGQVKVAWINENARMILSVQNQVITRNWRVSVTFETKPLETFCEGLGPGLTITVYTLHIKFVNKSDAGKYLCQMNTDPMRDMFLEIAVNEGSEGES